VNDIVETGITWDHDQGTIMVSTRRRAVASKLKRLGLQPTENHGYTNFVASEKELRISFRKPYKLSPERRAAAAKRLSKTA